MQHLRFSLLFTALFTLLGQVSPAHAEIVITNISGASVITGFISTGDNSNLRIFAGFAGDETKGDFEGGCARKVPGVAATCNNCVVDGSNFNSCNLTRAYPTGEFSISFSSTSLAPQSPTDLFTPTIQPVYNTTTSGVNVLHPNKSPTQVNAPNQVATITIPWSDLCKATDDPADTSGATDPTLLSHCKISKTMSFLIGFDSGTDGLGGSSTGAGGTTASDDSTTISITFEGTDDQLVSAGALGPNGASLFNKSSTDPSTCTAGICNFSLKPGDQKAFVENVSIKDAAGVETNLAYLDLYCDTTTTPGDYTVVTQSKPTGHMPITSGGLSDNKLTGLANGTTYSCYAAAEDEAGNIGLFSKFDDTGCSSFGADPHCRQVSPDDVIGLFSKKQNCFIATAAYGSPMEKHVAMLREFRNKYMAPSPIGRGLVYFYYTVSPPIAHWIAQDPARRSVTRALLTPVVWSVSVFMNWSWILGWAALFVCCLLAFRRKFSQGL